MTRLRTSLVGTFVLLGLLLFGGGLFLIGDRRLLFARQFELAATFTKVTGLQVGTRVRVAGLDAGEVLEVRLPARPSDAFLVRMRLREDLHHLVRTNSMCAIQTDGIVGSAFVQISVGTDDAPPVESGQTIEGTPPVEFADVIQEGRSTFQTVSREVVALTSDMSTAVAALTGTIQTSNSLIESVNRNMGELTTASTQVMSDAGDVLADVQGVVSDVRDGRGTLGRLLTDEALYDRMVAVGAEAEETMRNVRETSDRARATVESFGGRDGTAQQIAQTLRNTLTEVQEVTSDLSDASEAIKRNFFFRGFFQNRGFFDLDTVSREAYLSGALEGKDRTALRIWIESDKLFSEQPDGTERLTDAGRQRLDSAMADFVRYPRDSPLVVEGYAESREGEAAYLRSADRAQTVRDYLLGRFRRQATLTGVMPMAAEAPGSPNGDGQWSGVALALFVRTEDLARGGDAAR